MGNLSLKKKQQLAAATSRRKQLSSLRKGLLQQPC